MKPNVMCEKIINILVHVYGGCFEGYFKGYFKQSLLCWNKSHPRACLAISAQTQKNFRSLLSLVFTSDAITSASVRALISQWKWGSRKHEHKHKDPNSFSLCWRFCLRSLASCESETQHKLKEICYAWPIKALVSDSPRLSIWTKWWMPWLILMLICRRSFLQA